MRTRVVLGVVALLSVHCEQERGSPVGVPHPTALPQVQSALVESASPERRELVGTVLAAERRRLSFDSAGQLSKLFVEEGDAVKAGTLLATLEQTDARARALAARAALAQATRESERAVQLERTGAVSSAIRERAVTDVDAARANWQLATGAMRRSSLYAPVDGVVREILVHRSEALAAGAAVIVFEDAKRVIELAVCFDEARELVLGEPFAWNRGDLASIAHVSRVDDSADADGMYTVRLTADDALALPLAGALVHVSYREQAPAGVRIPLDALVRRGDEHHVFVLRGPAQKAVARAQAVSVVSSSGGSLLVRDGLRPGDRIVAEGAYFLSDGELVSYL